MASRVIRLQRFFLISKQAVLHPGRERRSLDRSYSPLDYNRIYGSTYFSEPKNGPRRLPIGTVCAWIEPNLHRLGDRLRETECQFGPWIGNVCLSVPSGQTFQQFVICDITTREDATVVSERTRFGNRVNQIS